MVRYLPLCFLILTGCGTSDSNTPQPIYAEPIPTPMPECRRDLAGTCRHNPPSMGALEVT